MSNNIATSSKRWDLSIEMLKAIAALLVMNSHMDAMYGEYSYLGTGGAIGDALFFFCSGYSIFLSQRVENFFNWYKRRIQRIIPSVAAVFIIGAICSLFNIYAYVEFNWFLQCIMIYYMLLYPIKRYASNYMWWIILLVAVVTVGWYFIFGVNPRADGGIYGVTMLKWCFFFMYMLLGAICGKSRMSTKNSLNENALSNCLRKYSVLLSQLGLFVSLLSFYAIYYYATRLEGARPYILFSLIPLMGICWFLWRFAITDFSKKIMNNRWIGTILRFIGGLCLEILVCQQMIFTTKLNHLFPWNIPLIMIFVILFAYVVRVLSRWLLQTFQKEDYDWRAMVAPF